MYPVKVALAFSEPDTHLIAKICAGAAVVFCFESGVACFTSDPVDQSDDNVPESF